MILTCAHCQTQFAVPDGAIGPNGRKVKCSRCGNIWHQLPLNEIADVEDILPPPEELHAIPMGSNLPVVSMPRHSVGLFVKILFLILLILASAAGVIANRKELMDSMPGLFHALGLKPSDGLIFTNLAMEKEPVGNMFKVRISGSIKNVSSESMEIPTVLIRTISATNEMMSTIPLTMPISVLRPGQETPFEPEISNLSANVHHIVVDIGNSWELFFRQQAEPH